MSDGPKYYDGQTVWAFEGEISDIAKNGTFYRKMQTRIIAVSDDGFSAVIETSRVHKAVRLSLLYTSEAEIDAVIEQISIKDGDLATGWDNHIWGFVTGLVTKVNKASVDIVDTSSGRDLRVNKGSCVRVSKK
jgi:hypothetical protein